MDITGIISKKLDIKEESVKNAINLLDDGATIAFIARYRKEKTGGLTDINLRDIESLLGKYRNLQKRQEEVINSISNQGKLTDDLEKEILNTSSITELEDIYNPYKKKKKTRADIARELGLSKLLDAIMKDDLSENEINSMAMEFVDDNINLEGVIDKTSDILAEDISNNVDIRNIIRRDGFVRAKITLSKKDDPESIYKNYYDMSLAIKNLKPYQVLAINRAEKNNALDVKFEFSDEYNKVLISNLFDLNGGFKEKFVKKAIEDSYKRLLLPQIKTEIKNSIVENAEDESIKVFSKNLKPYILQKPIKKQNIIGLDPGYRTGCKVAAINENGKYLESTVIYPAKPREDVKGSIKVLTDIIKRNNITLIALGNGTASRETEIMVNELIKSIDSNLSYAIVNEAGASIYSASKLAEEEFPDLDVTIRGAISMARRLQDPMAELVKIDPKHIGVGQYQHDLNQKKLDDELKKVVEDAVNEVGVNITNASYTLLSYVSGLNTTIAKRIEESVKDGSIKQRKDLKNVKGLGEKTYKMASGFLRFPDSPNFLDNTAVHPESYNIAKKLVDYNLDDIDYNEVSNELNVGIPTLKDIVIELKKPGRDPREENPEVITKSEIMTIDDIKEGMILKGKVRNVVEFGCFVDIGVGIDGLVYISNMSDSYVKEPSDIVKVSDIINVKIIEIDKERKRIGLSMKDL